MGYGLSIETLAGVKKITFEPVLSFQIVATI